MRTRAHIHGHARGDFMLRLKLKMLRVGRGHQHLNQDNQHTWSDVVLILTDNVSTLATFLSFLCCIVEQLEPMQSKLFDASVLSTWALPDAARPIIGT